MKRNYFSNLKKRKLRIDTQFINQSNVRHSQLFTGIAYIIYSGFNQGGREMWKMRSKISLHPYVKYSFHCAHFPATHN